MSALQVTAEAPRARVRVMTTSHAADLWLGELARQNRSARTTIPDYRRILNKLCDMYPWHDVGEIDVTMLRRFLDRQAVNARTGKPNAAGTMAQKVSVVTMFFGWLHDENYIPANPAFRLKRPKQLPRTEEDDHVTSVSTAELQRMLAACENWREKLCVHVLAYTGSRRHAVAQLKIGDYDGFATPPTLTFREKGGKTIRKPVPDKLAELINAASLAGVWASPDDYLIPGRAEQRRAGERDDRIIHRVVKTVAERAGVTTHVHALRAAFAVYFLESKPNQLVALQQLMGHARLETTQHYLRRLDRMRSMEAVLDLDWESGSAIGAKPVTEKEGFEPSIGAKADEQTVGSPPADLKAGDE